MRRLTDLVRTPAGTRSAPAFVMAAAIAAVVGFGGCSRKSQHPAVESRPAGEPPTTAVAPRETEPAATKPAPVVPQTAPATAPATRPEEELPPSTFDSKPPYTVQLYVRKPEDRDKQPGWLKILELEDKNAIAKAHGVFPRQNRIEVLTENVRRIEVELRYLPLGPDKRVVLDIDKMGREITQRDRPFLTLERRPTGEWVVEKSEKE